MSPIRILDSDIHLIELNTRLPFKYGIATMTSAPHAFVRVHAHVAGRRVIGIAADHLPPKWFTKVPDKPLDEEIDEMLAVIEHAVTASRGLTAQSVFGLWAELDAIQSQKAGEAGWPPLLSNFGTSLVERAAIEAVCKAVQKPFSRAVADDLFGLQLEHFDRRLSGLTPSALLPDKPRQRITARHTVGMADPLDDDDVADKDRLHDGLPQSLAECIRRYGLKHFKIKVRGDPDADAERIARVARLIHENAGREFAFTLDGNEQFRTLESFRDFWTAIVGRDEFAAFFQHLLFVEQPFHRDVALDPSVLADLPRWQERPPLITDESDAECDSLARALELGYNGTSHKNCKGVLRGIAHACLLEHLRRQGETGPFLMSGEDLANIGPVALLQDLATAATLGIASVERNGHHYFAGLSAFSDDVQENILSAHADLYERSEAGWPTLRIADGELKLDSVNAAPFGVGFELDVEPFPTADAWRKQRRT